MQNQWSIYYTAIVKKELTWLVSSAVRGTEHIAFDRCLDSENHVFEFFVSPDFENVLLQVFQYLIKENALISYQKKNNRYQELHN